MRDIVLFRWITLFSELLDNYDIGLKCEAQTYLDRKLKHREEDVEHDHQHRQEENTHNIPPERTPTTSAGNGDSTGI